MHTHQWSIVNKEEQEKKTRKENVNVITWLRFLIHRNSDRKRDTPKARREKKELITVVSFTCIYIVYMHIVCSKWFDNNQDRVTVSIMIRLRHKHPHGNVRRFGIVLLILFLETGAHTVGTVPAKAKTTLMHQPLDNLTNFSAPKEPSSYFSKYFQCIEAFGFFFFAWCRCCVVIVVSPLFFFSNTQSTHFVAVVSWVWRASRVYSM